MYGKLLLTSNAHVFGTGKCAQHFICVAPSSAIQQTNKIHETIIAKRCNTSRHIMIIVHLQGIDAIQMFQSCLRPSHRHHQNAAQLACAGGLLQPVTKLAEQTHQPQ